jgi:hypothetical protein
MAKFSPIFASKKSCQNQDKVIQSLSDSSE